MTKINVCNVNYEVTILGIVQPVTVYFSLNIGGLSVDSVAIQGDNLPLLWTVGSTVMTDDDSNKIYTIAVTFPESTTDTVQYKYAAYDTIWRWESIAANRKFVIDDSDSMQILAEDYWNDEQVSELTEVSFLSEASSIFTNFSPDLNLHEPEQSFPNHKENT